MHRLKAHGVPTVQPRIEKDPSISVLQDTIRLLKLKVTEADLEKRLPQPEPPKSSPTMLEIAQAEYFDRKTEMLKNQPTASAGDSGEVVSLRAKVDELAKKLVDKDKEAMDARFDSIDKKLDRLDHPARSSSSSEKVEFAEILANAVDHAGDRFDRKIGPLMQYVFQGNLGDKEYVPGAQDNSGVLKRIKPEWIVEE